MKKLPLIVLFILLLGVPFIIYYLYSTPQHSTPQPSAPDETPAETVGSGTSPLNTSYTVEGQVFTLSDGYAEKETGLGSAIKNRVSVFGAPAYGDIDGDGDQDALVILINEPGGTGIFYYATVALNVDGAYKGTDAALLGDRISMQTFSIQDNRAEINYVIRAVDEPFTAQPSIGKTAYFKVDPETLQLASVAVYFEGEANPDMMSLTMQTWKWIETRNGDGQKITPKNLEVFTLTFTPDGTFSARTDCNSISGEYTHTDSSITFNNAAMTQMFCQDSQESEFSALLRDMRAYHFTSKGELIFDLESENSSVVFR